MSTISYKIISRRFRLSNVIAKVLNDEYDGQFDLIVFDSKYLKK